MMAGTIILQVSIPATKHGSAPFGGEISGMLEQDASGAKKNGINIFFIENLFFLVVIKIRENLLLQNDYSVDFNKKSNDDTWKWKNSYCTERIVRLAEQLSMLFNYWSGESFEEIMLTNLKASTILTSENLAEVKTLTNLKDKYIFKKVSEALIYTNLEEGVGSCFAYVEAEQYGNEISDIILNIDEYRKKLPRCPMSYYPKVNYVVIRQGSYLSFRSKNECAKGISELFEGGGHLNASGAPIPLKYITKIPKLISDVVMGEKIIKNNEVYLKIKEE